MCLTTLKRFKVQKRDGKYLGYKVFIPCGEAYQSLYWKTFLRYKRRVWYQDFSRSKILAANDVRYQSGFHIFTRKRDAESYSRYSGINSKVKRVEFRNILHTGRQSIYNCVIAKEIKIL